MKRRSDRRKERRRENAVDVLTSSQTRLAPLHHPPNALAHHRPVSPSPSRPVAPSSRSHATLFDHALITLLTDFGAADYFVSAMRGVILSINPAAHIVDITHEIPPQDIDAAAFTLLAAYPAFPANTVHVAVVDPGVGSSRRAILVEAGGQFFIGPDNGILSYVLERETDIHLFEITNSEYFRHPVSQTFHGRDVFAPVAAALTTGITPETLGKRITNPVKLGPLIPEKLKNGDKKGRIIHIDRFGNCITNLTSRDLTPRMIHRGAELRIKGKTIKSFKSYFSEDTGAEKKPFAIWGSAGFLELAASNRSAAELLKLKRGDTVLIKVK